MVLEQLVLQNLQRVVAYAQDDEDAFVQRVIENKTAVQQTEQEQAELKQSIEELCEVVAAAEAQTVNIQSFMKIVKKYTEPTELTPTLLREFLEKVVVHAPDKSSGHRVQRIDVHYNFIGEIDFSPEFSQYSKKTTI